MDKNTSGASRQISHYYKNVNQQKDLTQMNSLDIRTHFATAGEEFSSKMGENFKCYVFIAASAGRQSLEEIIQNMAFFAGYKMHKTVGCSKRIYHLYVKYETESIAIAARDYFRMKDLNAELVFDMLHLWYAFEMASGQTKCRTIGWLSLSDGTPTLETAKKLLKKYGNPFINIWEGSVKVSFDSISEAFGACIALGTWYTNKTPAETKYFTVKIELSDYFSRIMVMCNMTSVSSELDYFVPKDQNVNSKRNVNKTLHPNEIDPSQKSCVPQKHYVKRSKTTEQKIQNYRIFKKQNFGDVQLPSKQNMHSQTTV